MLDPMFQYEPYTELENISSPQNTYVNVRSIDVVTLVFLLKARGRIENDSTVIIGLNVTVPIFALQTKIVAFSLICLRKSRIHKKKHHDFEVDKSEPYSTRRLRQNKLQWNHREATRTPRESRNHYQLSFATHGHAGRPLVQQTARRLMCPRREFPHSENLSLSHLHGVEYLKIDYF